MAKDAARFSNIIGHLYFPFEGFQSSSPFIHWMAWGLGISFLIFFIDPGN